MKLYDEDATSDDIQEQIEELESCIENLKEVKERLKELDKNTCKDYIKATKELIENIELEIESLEEEKEEKEEQERIESIEEMQYINCEFERSRV